MAAIAHWRGNNFLNTARTATSQININNFKRFFFCRAASFLSSFTARHDAVLQILCSSSITITFRTSLNELLKKADVSRSYYSSYICWMSRQHKLNNSLTILLLHIVLSSTLPPSSHLSTVRSIPPSQMPHINEEIRCYETVSVSVCLYMHVLCVMVHFDASLAVYQFMPFDFSIRS